MTRQFSLLGHGWQGLVALAAATALMLAAPSIAYAQHSRQPHGGGGGQSSGGSGGHSSAGGRQSSGGGQTAHAAPAPRPTPTTSQSGQTKSSGGDSGNTGRAVPREGATSGSGDSGTGASGGAVTREGSSEHPGGSNPVPPYSRPRDGRTATGDAVERRPNSNGGGTTVIVSNGGYGGGFYPWGYGGLGFGSYYGADYYDPWWYDGYGSGYVGYGYDGALRLKVKPREASVYVDGYFAGRVDDFDGTFQRLKIESGPHRVEIRLDGYDTLMFEVRIQPDRTVTYTGELKKLP
jgi:hypothetical protein